MAYEFTKLKIRAERQARRKRLVASVLSACVGLAIGIATNDMHSPVGAFAAITLAILPGFAVYWSMT